MRRAARVDDNQSEIVEAYRAHGCSVAITSAVGDGFTDIVVGYRGLSELVEIKDGSKKPSLQKLTPDQERFHGEWKGAIRVVRSIGDVKEHIKEMRERA